MEFFHATKNISVKMFATHCIGHGLSGSRPSWGALGFGAQCPCRDRQGLAVPVLPKTIHMLTCKELRHCVETCAHCLLQAEGTTSSLWQQGESSQRMAEDPSGLVQLTAVSPSSSEARSLP